MTSSLNNQGKRQPQSVLCDLPNLSDRGRCSTGSTELRLSVGLDEWSWCSAAPPFETPTKWNEPLFTPRYETNCLTVSMTRYLRAVSPSIPSSGLRGSLDRAWERKRRGTAHQCLEQSCWIIWSNAGPTDPPQQSEIYRHFGNQSELLFSLRSVKNKNEYSVITYSPLGQL